ncbi:MAG: 50S ribosomal protein L18Ae [Candidatus Micrarchaeota archaeon]|nr:50S ribosomal protein L18Ae [Candidatus Micrarchaeota archaeon]
MKFGISGEIKISGELRKFDKTVEANSEKQAKDTVYALFGSSNRLKRTAIKIITVNKL